MSSLVTNNDDCYIPPEGWNLKWENPDEIKKQEEIKKKENLEKLKEDQLKNEERQKRREVNDKIQKEKRKEDEKKWRAWYEKVKNYPLKKFSRSKNPKKIKERFNELLKEIRKNWTFSGRINYINGTLEKLSDEKKINLYLIYKNDLKEEDKQKKKDKIKLFIKKEEELEKECKEWSVEYIKYDTIPKDQWKKNEYGNAWYGKNYYISSRYKDMKLKIKNKKEIKIFIEDEEKKEKECNILGIDYIPYNKPIPEDLNYLWISKNSNYSSERNKKMREDKEKLELNKEWNKINYEERKKIIEIFERIAKEKEDEILKRKKQQEANQLKYKMKNQLKNAFNSYLYKNFYKLKVINKKEIKRNICFKKILEYINDKNIKENFNVIINSENKKNIDEYLNCDEIDNIINDLLEKKKQDNLPWPRKKYSGECKAIGYTGAVVHRYIYMYKDGTEKLESNSSFNERVWDERQNQNPYN